MLERSRWRPARAGRAAIGAGLLWCVTGCAAADARQPSPSRDVAFVDVTVLPMTADTAWPHATVLVRQGKILRVGPVNAVAVPSGALRVDGRGRFLMPGLADMHVHLYDTQGFASYLAHGVTTIANLNGFPEALTWRDRVIAGRLAGPTLYTAGPSVNGYPPGNSTFQSAQTPDEARAIVRQQARAGYDLVKVYSTLAPDVYAAVLDEARRQHLPVLGHIPRESGLDGVLRGGHQSNIAHGEELLTSVGRGRERDTTGIGEAARAIQRAGVYVTPNLLTYSDYLRSVEDLPGRLRDPEMRYASPAQLSEKLPAHNRSVRPDPAGFANALRVGHTWIARMTKALADAHAPMLLGTDTEIFGYPGASAIEELDELVAAGLTPYQALETATRTAGEYVARHVRAGDRFGTVVEGARADLLLLDADPRARIDAVRRIAGVMARGRWYSADDLTRWRAALADTLTPARDAATRLDSLIRIGRLDDARRLFDTMRHRWPNAPPLAEVVFEEDATSARTAADAATLLGMSIATYPRSFSTYTTRARARLTAGDTAGARDDLRRALAIDSTNLIARTLTTRLALAATPARATPVGTYELREVGVPGSTWTATLTIADSGGTLRGTLRTATRTIALPLVRAHGDALWLESGGYPDELPTVQLTRRGATVSGRVIGGFGSNHPVEGTVRE